MTSLLKKVLYVVVFLAVVAICFFIYQITQPLPPLARDLPSSYEKGDKVFQNRIRSAFPSGTDEQTAITRLKQEGFSIDPDDYDRYPHGHTAVYRTNGIPCETDWVIRWQTDSGHTMTNITSKYGASCM